MKLKKLRLKKMWLLLRRDYIDQLDLKVFLDSYHWDKFPYIA